MCGRAFNGNYHDDGGDDSDDKSYCSYSDESSQTADNWIND